MDSESIKAEFLAVVRAFCAWAEAPEPASNAEIMAVRAMLLRLLLLAPELERIVPFAEFKDGASYRLEYRKLTTRMEKFPEQVYSMVFDPFDKDDREVLYGALWDDLEDIYRDLKEGLNGYDAGEHDAAFYCWSSIYRIHWGRHANMAAMALTALHIDLRLMTKQGE